MRLRCYCGTAAWQSDEFNSDSWIDVLTPEQESELADAALALPADESMWQGDCFVFDNRVSVDHDLAVGRYELCPACRMPLSEEDRQSSQFEQNVSCPSCYDHLTPERRASLEERGRQIKLAEARGEKHIGRR